MQLHAGRDFNYRTSCKVLHFKYLLPCQQSAETRLAGSCCCRAAFFHQARALRFNFRLMSNGATFPSHEKPSCRAEPGKEKVRVLHLSSNGRLFSAKHRQRKNSRTEAFQSTADSSANRKPKLMLPTTFWRLAKKRISKH